MRRFLYILITIIFTISVTAQDQYEIAVHIMGAFNADYYLATNPDVQADIYFGASPAGALEHYISNGIEEDRSPNPFFVPEYYRNIHADLHDHDPQQLREHWLLHGISEGRRGSPDFYLRWYLENNSDLLSTFGEGNTEAAFDHYIRHGMFERRQTSPDGQVLSSRYLQNLPYFIQTGSLPTTVYNGIDVYIRGFRGRVDVTRGHAEWFVSPEGEVKVFLRQRSGNSGSSRILSSAALLDRYGIIIWVSPDQTLTVGTGALGPRTDSEWFILPNIETSIMEQATYLEIFAVRDSTSGIWDPIRDAFEHIRGFDGCPQGWSPQENHNHDNSQTTNETAISTATIICYRDH